MCWTIAGRANWVCRIEDVAAYKGPAGTVQARITGLTKAVGDLRARRGTDPKVARFADTATARLGELSAAATATLSMPSGTQRAALRAASADLDQLDAELMTFLVGPATLIIALTRHFTDR